MELMKLLPESQDELPVRKMSDSFDHAIIPLGQDLKLREKYMNPYGGVRVGRLLEDMDVFAVHLVFKHVVNPRQPPGDTQLVKQFTKFIFSIIARLIISALTPNIFALPPNDVWPFFLLLLDPVFHCYCIS